MNRLIAHTNKYITIDLLANSIENHNAINPFYIQAQKESQYIN